MVDIQTETDVTSILNSYAARQPDTDATIKAGFVLAEDRSALVGFADPSQVAG